MYTQIIMYVALTIILFLLSGYTYKFFKYESNSSNKLKWLNVIIGVAAIVHIECMEYVYELQLTPTLASALMFLFVTVFLGSEAIAKKVGVSAIPLTLAISYSCSKLVMLSSIVLA